MRERQPNIIVDVTRSTEAIDFDAWAKQYVRALLQAHRAKQAEAA